MSVAGIKDHHLKARINPGSYIFVSGVLILLSAAVFFYSILLPLKGSFTVSAFLAALSVVWYFIMSSNKLEIDNGLILSKPFLSKSRVFDPDKSELIVYRMGLSKTSSGRPSVIDVSSRDGSFGKTSIPARLFREVDVEEFLKLAEMLGAKLVAG